MEIANKDVCVEFVNIGEGMSGDYDPSDPNDMPFMRMNIYHAGRKEWELVESFCTLIHARTPVGILSGFGLKFIDKATPKLKKGESIKALAEKASNWGKSTHKYAGEEN